MKSHSQHHNCQNSRAVNEILWKFPHILGEAFPGHKSCCMVVQLKLDIYQQKSPKTYWRFGRQRGFLWIATVKIREISLTALITRQHPPDGVLGLDAEEEAGGEVLDIFHAEVVVAGEALLQVPWHTE